MNIRSAKRRRRRWRAGPQQSVTTELRVSGGEAESVTRIRTLDSVPSSWFAAFLLSYFSFIWCFSSQQHENNQLVQHHHVSADLNVSMCVEGQTINVCLHQNTKNMDNKCVRDWFLHLSHTGPERLFLSLGVTGSSEHFCQRASVASSEGPSYLLQGGTVEGRSCPSLHAFIRRRAAVFRVGARKSEEEAWGETLVLLLFVKRHKGGRDHNEADFYLRSICQDAPPWESKEESLSCCVILSYFAKMIWHFYFICKEMNLKVASR